MVIDRNKRSKIVWYSIFMCISMLTLVSCLNTNGESQRGIISLLDYLNLISYEESKSDISFYSFKGNYFGNISFDDTSQALSYSFGDILFKSKSKTTFYFSNAGEKSVQLQDIQTTSGSIDSRWTKDTIHPGESGNIIVAYNANSLGHFKDKISVFYNKNDFPIDIVVEGKVVENVSKKRKTINDIKNCLLEDYNNPPRLTSFTKRRELLNVLEYVSFKQFNKWRLSKSIHNEKKWSSETGVRPIGGVSINGTQNHISYQILGKEEDYVNEINVNLKVKTRENE